MKSKFNSIRNRCRLVSDTFDLTIFFVNQNGDIIFEQIKNKILNPIYKNKKQNLFKSLEFDPKIKYKFPVIKENLFFEKYVIVSVVLNNEFKGTALIGPSISHPISEDKINGFINDSQAFSLRKQIINYFNNVPILQFAKLINISIMIYYMFNKKLLSRKTVINKNKKPIKQVKINKKLDLEVSKNLQTHSFHPDPLLEKKFLNIVKEGRVEDLKEDSSEIMDKEFVNVLSRSSYIRSIKNQVIVLIALVSRAAVDGGLHPEIAFTLGDTFIQRLEELYNFNEIKSLAREVRYTFTHKVSQIKKERYSKTITICQDFIFSNIYEDINLDDIAEKVGISPNYLPVLFRKEVGIPISEYINQIKIDEAKKLISYSQKPLAEISALLNFSDQSYFTKVFKKFVGTTPKQYREKQHLLSEPDKS